MAELGIFFGLLVFGCTASAQLEPMKLDPSALNSKTKKIKGDHLIYETPVQRIGKLLVTVGGTNSRPSNFAELQYFATTLGYDVIAVDYPNTVTTVKCRGSNDPDCFDKYHQEIVFGKEVSPLCVVDVNNSLQMRLEDALKFLSSTHSRWREYYSDGKVHWQQLVLVGHSQGSGHVAYLAKQFKVERVFLIAGPQDHSDALPAAWLERPGATPNSRYFALLHKDDFYNAKLQLKSFYALIGRFSDQTSVQPNSSQTQQAIVSEKPVKDPHNELIKKIFIDEWALFLRSR
jgi:pimeloyl-ACP methyl ester carboxylesterase